jgi:8-oxo-dGTP pyrophosphatase MutT (NUDIX family)
LRKPEPTLCYKGAVPNEFSAGAVVLRRLRGRWWLAAIRPHGKPEGVWALPKGNVSRGDSPEVTALREVTEETGLEGDLVGKLGDVKYFYVRKGGERVFKVVTFFLVRYRRGRIGEIPPEHAHEVEEARWLPLDDAPKLLAYKGEREMAEQARVALEGEVV